MRINGQPLEALGVTFSAVTPFRGRPRRARDRFAIVDGAGVAPARRATQGAREFTVQGYVGPAAVGTIGGRVELLDALERAVAGWCAVELDDSPGRAIDAECLGIDVRPVNTVYGAPAFEVDLHWVAYDATWRDTEPRVTSFGATATAIATGTASHGGVVRLMGSATNPVLTCQRPDGTTAWSLTFTVALAAEDFLEVDLDARTVVLSDAGVRTNGLALWTAGEWGVLEPAVDAALSPALAVSAGAGVHVGARRWR